MSTLFAFMGPGPDASAMGRMRAYRDSPEVTIRWATPDDGARLRVLAELEEAEIPAAPLLLALVAGELWVAMSAATGEAICDPFRPSAEVARLVGERRRQLTVENHGRSRSALRWLGDLTPRRALAARARRA